jgi:hypothetical protein
VMQMQHSVPSTLVENGIRIVTGIEPNVRSFKWAVVQCRGIRRRIRIEGAAARVPPPTDAGPRGWLGVRAGIVLLRPTCLERALVIQAWVGGYAEPPDVVIGVRRRAGVVEAHAWVDGSDPWFDPSYHEIARFDA